MTGFRKQVGRHVLRKVVVPGLVLYLSLVAVGLLLAFPLRNLLKPEDEVNRDLAVENAALAAEIAVKLSER